MNYMSVKQAAKKWRISERRVHKLCETGRIPGAERLGYVWAIPNDAGKPADKRKKENKI